MSEPQARGRASHLNGQMPATLSTREHGGRYLGGGLALTTPNGRKRILEMRPHASVRTSSSNFCFETPRSHGEDMLSSNPLQFMSTPGSPISRRWDEHSRAGAVLADLPHEELRELVGVPVEEVCELAERRLSRLPGRRAPRGERAFRS